MIKKGICKKSFLSIFSFFLAIAVLTSFGKEPVFGVEGIYTDPGVVAFRGGKWVGSDHLYNLSNHIAIVAEIYKPKKLKVPFTEEMIHERIAAIFNQGGIIPFAEKTAGPPLPFFHMLIMVYPVGKDAEVAFCDGRLFENIKVHRIVLDEQTVMQGITWESQKLVVSRPDALSQQVFKSVDAIAKDFVERFQFYENIRMQIQR